MEELRILVWGITGVGKSSFIKACGAKAVYFEKSKDGEDKKKERVPEVSGSTASSKSGKNALLGTDLIRHCWIATKEVVPYAFVHKHQGKEKRVILIDMPGFNANDMDAADILAALAFFFNTANHHYGQQPWLHGVMYLHGIDAEKWLDSDQDCLALLEFICGEVARPNPYVVSNKWDEAGHSWKRKQKFAFTEKGLQEKDLRLYAERMIKRKGSSKSDTVECVERLWHAKPVSLRMTTEMQDGRKLYETTAGRFLVGKMNSNIEQLRTEISQQPGDSGKLANLALMVKEKDLFEDIDAKTMDSVGESLHVLAGILATPGVIFVEPVTWLLYGPPLLATAGFVEFLAIGAQIVASRMRNRAN